MWLYLGKTLFNSVKFYSWYCVLGCCQLQWIGRARRRLPLPGRLLMVVMVVVMGDGDGDGGDGGGDGGGQG